MGFPKGRAITALKQFASLRDAEAIEKAVEWLFNNNDVVDDTEPEDDSVQQQVSDKVSRPVQLFQDC